jgi:hypothetical protein
MEGHMNANPALALLWIGILSIVGPMSAHARNGGGHSANSSAHAGSQNQPGAAKSQATKKKGNKEPYLNYGMKDATVSAAKAKKGKVQIHDMHIIKTMDKSSP